MSGERSRKACATPLTMLVAPGPRVDRQMPGHPVMSPQVAASMAPATSCFISRNRIWRWRAASMSSTDSPPGWPTMNGVPASLNAVASTSTVVVMGGRLSNCCCRLLRAVSRTGARKATAMARGADAGGISGITLAGRAIGTIGKLTLPCKNHAAIFRDNGVPMIDRPRRASDPRQAAEAAFKAATNKPLEPIPPKKPLVPNAKEMVSLRIDRDVLDYFQGGGPGWQDRVNEALRKAAGK